MGKTPSIVLILALWGAASSWAMNIDALDMAAIDGVGFHEFEERGHGHGGHGNGQGSSSSEEDKAEFKCKSF